MILCPKRSMLIAFCLLAGPLTELRGAEPRAPVDLILVAGQSNAVGYDAKPEELPADPADKDVLFWWRCGDPPPDEHDSTSGGRWTHLGPQPRGNPIPRMQGLKRQYGNFAGTSGGFGPEIGLARTLRQKEGKPLAILKAAFSGTGMRTDWNPTDSGPAGACYRTLVAETRKAIAAAKAQGIALRPRALVWVQGESDANATDAPNYVKALGAMIRALRRDLDAPELIALLGVNTRFGGGKNAFLPKIVEAQKALADSDSRCRYVDTAGSPIANAVHFSAAGTLEVGRRFAVALMSLADRAGTVLVEAEAFADRGGWVVDPQFMDLMGSPYLLAHGLGTPVKDAVTEVALPAAGTYRVWVRTKDWVAQWKAPGAPGRFRVIVDGRPLEAVFGTQGAAWHWQDGGRVEVAKRRLRIALDDLTGFEGRCDAILFARDLQFRPPDDGPALAALRRECLGLARAPEPAGEFDLVVTGGGIAGTCAALSAARLGLTVALVQDRPVLGGNNSSEVRVWLQGSRNKEPWPRVGDVVAELEQARRAHYGPANTAELYEDAKKLALVRAEPKIRLFLEHRANEVELDAGRIRAVIAQDVIRARRYRLGGRWFADCTGDAALGALAGADFQLEPKGHMGPCNLWNVTATSGPVAFPRCPWALDLSQKPFPGRQKPRPDPLQLGGWYWESGFDRDPIGQMEYVRDWNFRAMYGAWDALKNVDKSLPNYKLNWSAHIMGKRESRRLLGDVVLTLDDLKQGRRFPDGCAPTGWSVDLHLPDPRYEKGFEGDAFISEAKFGRYRMPFWIPYRSLYSRNVSNLFMAGRDISVTHEALGAVRVMRTGGCMGEIVGMAASLAKKHGTTPRGIYQNHWSEMESLMRRGVGKTPGTNPEYENGAEPRRPKRQETKEN